MNTDKLLEFQVLAQTLHFGKAASKLFMSQSVLTRHIQDLENELGLQLFIRSPHSVTLTNAGASLYRSLGPFIKQYNEAGEKARISSLSAKGAVNFSCLRPVFTNDIFGFIKYFCDRYPDIFLKTNIIDNYDDQGHSSQDFIFTSTMTQGFPDNFRLQKTFYEKGFLAVPAAHRFDSYSHFSLSALSDETVFLPGNKRTSGSFSKIGQMIERSTGGHAKIISVNSPETALLNVSLGRGVSILPKHRLEETKYSNVRLAGIKEKCTFEMFLFKNKDNDSPELQLFNNELIKYMTQRQNDKT